MARIGRASAGLGARLISTCVCVWVGTGDPASPAASGCVGAGRSWPCSSSSVLLASNLLDFALELGVERRWGILALGNERFRVGHDRRSRRTASGAGERVSRGMGIRLNRYICRPVMVEEPRRLTGARRWSRHGRGRSSRYGGRQSRGTGLSRFRYAGRLQGLGRSLASGCC